jgi:hypothetical protein
MTDGNRDPERVTERTTVVHTDTGRRGGGGTIALVVLVLLVLIGLFMFRDQLFGGGAADTVEKIDVDISTNGS